MPEVANFAPVPRINPIKLPIAAFVAFDCEAPPVISPIKAPINGPIITPTGGSSSMPATRPRVAPIAPLLDPPNFLVVHAGMM